MMWLMIVGGYLLVSLILKGGLDHNYKVDPKKAGTNDEDHFVMSIIWPLLVLFLIYDKFPALLYRIVISPITFMKWLSSFKKPKSESHMIRIQSDEIQLEQKVYQIGQLQSEVEQLELKTGKKGYR